MKLLRYGPAGAEKPGLLDSAGLLRDLSDHVADITGDVLDDASLARLGEIDPASLPIVEGEQRIAPCVGNIGKFLCIGLNYSDHAAETGAAIPEHPILFFKANSAIVGAYDDVVMPRGSTKTDWEAKLTGQWTKGKSCDTFGPTGPWLVTRDEVGDPQNLSMSCDVNGKRMQTGNTKTMIFSVAEIIEHLSSLMTLHPGDVITTGTPPGVGLGIKPEPVFLKVGDTMDLTIEGLGHQRQTVGQDA
ncbi:Ureidoglycolate lyase [Nymphon striatum]|nr:Ureidoglycolate lyase [Nymphon striatum]